VFVIHIAKAVAKRWLSRNPRIFGRGVSFVKVQGKTQGMEMYI
jgi:hypothetical protein